jgi:NADPH:quinone reductase-like Zn-dependent oxidoreductase
MKAVRFHEYGAPEVLRYEDAPRPEPAAGQVLVKVHATSVNPVDWKIRAGHLRGFREYLLPFILGWDFSGVIEAVGAGVEEWKQGDEVYGHPNIAATGTYAEYAVAPVGTFARKPTSLDHAHAAAIPLAGLTAWQALFDHARLASGQKVLIQAAAGGVGTFAVQFARIKGLQIAATASAANHALLRELGAGQVIDYTATRFEDVVHNADAVIEAIGGEVRERSWKTLKKSGILVALIGPAPAQQTADSYGVRQALMWVQGNRAQLEEIGRLVDAGEVRPVIDTVLPLREAAQAHYRSQTGHARGKIVLRVV